MSSCAGGSTEALAADLCARLSRYWHETTTLSNVSLSFNSYFGWDNTDNEFLVRLCGMQMSCRGTVSLTLCVGCRPPALSCCCCRRQPADT